MDKILGVMNGPNNMKTVAHNFDPIDEVLITG